MAKRFTDTNKYKKPFVRSLPAAYKLLWDFLYHDCDHAGIWIVDFEIAQTYLGNDVKVEKEMALELFNSDEPRIIEIEGGKKWFIPSFIEFQYGRQLVTKNRMHVPIINILRKYNLLQYLDVDLVDEGTTVNAYRSRITKKVKGDILLRDSFKCQYCSQQYAFEELVVDHIISLDKGGDNDYENLCACCVRCNSHKTNLDLNDFLGRNLSFLNPTDFIKNKVLEAPYKKLQGVKDKEQEQEKEQYKDFGKSENLLSGIAHDMVAVFKTAFPKYHHDPEKDLPAVLQIAYKIGDGLNLTKHQVINGHASDVKKRWGELVEVIATDNWFRKQDLSFLNNHYQKVNQLFNDHGTNQGFNHKPIPAKQVSKGGFGKL